MDASLQKEEFVAQPWKEDGAMSISSVNKNVSVVSVCFALYKAYPREVW